MSGVYETVRATAAEFGEPENLVLGANVAAFRRVADAMIEQGVT
jgi:glutamate dehydrogenase (NADP+)